MGLGTGYIKSYFICSIIVNAKVITMVLDGRSRLNDTPKMKKINNGVTYVFGFHPTIEVGKDLTSKYNYRAKYLMR
jgi:hypothetical protein